METVDRLIEYCNSHLGDKELWHTPEGYPNSLALCIIDAIYSTGARYSSVVNVINRYKAQEGTTGGARALLESIAKAGGSRAWAKHVAENERRAHNDVNAPLKAEVIENAAHSMVTLGIDTVDDLVRAVSTNLNDNPVRTAWHQLPSQSSGVTYNYLLILAGLPSVKPDRMIYRFLESALGDSAPSDKEQVVALVLATAEKLDVSPRTLDYIMWRAASGRELHD